MSAAGLSPADINAAYPLVGAAGITTLYRAVSSGEFNQIMRTGAFEETAQSVSGKYFAETIPNAIE